MSEQTQAEARQDGPSFGAKVAAARVFLRWWYSLSPEERARMRAKGEKEEEAA